MRTHTYVHPQPGNSLCRSVGHDWKMTLRSTYRVCQRAHCRAAQRLVEGQWRDVTVDPPPVRRRSSSAAPAPTSTLWDGSSLEGTGILLHRSQPMFPGYKQAEERQRFHEYWCLSSDKR